MSQTRFWTCLLLAALLGLAGCGEEAEQPSEPEFDPAEARLAVQRAGEPLSDLRGGVDVEAVLADVREVADRYPDYAPAQVLLAQALLLTEHKDRALAALERALELDPEQPDVHDLAGAVALELDRPDRAIEHFNRALDLAPERGTFRVHLAKAQMDAGDLETARLTLLEALRFDASLHQAHAVLAELYAEQGQMGLALRESREAIDLATEQDPDEREDYALQRASLLRRGGEPAAAVAALRELPSRMWFDEKVMTAFARSFDQLGRPEAAARHYA
ncbi:MAG: tetratricopeptide repeat protein, partial [Phycisphaeraceae bacterium]